MVVPKKPDKVAPWEKGVRFAVTGYMCCSASLLVCNKLAVTYLPAPSFVLLCQLVATALAVKVAQAAGKIEMEPISWTLVSRFAIVPLAFVCAIFTNIKTLQYANVETFIVFRVATPILISVADWLWLGRELPSGRSAGCLVGLLFGACVYVQSDAHFEVRGYMWVAIWFCVFSFDQIYIKHKVDSVPMSNWARVFITNTIAALPLAVLGLFNGDVALVLFDHEWDAASLGALGVSCALGTAMSYFAFLARSQVSATYFTIIGNICKIASIVVNVLIWDKHATPTGMVGLLICLVFAYFYKQAPLRPEVAKQREIKRQQLSAGDKV